MHASWIDPTVLAYKILSRLYDWNRYPLAPLGCKAMVYKDGDTQGLWASHGVDRWYLGPLHDHFECNIYYILELCAYRILGLTKLLPQYCQLPDMTPHQRLHAIMDNLLTVLPPQAPHQKANASFACSMTG
jgi:hypothetical protein